MSDKEREEGGLMARLSGLGQIFVEAVTVPVEGSEEPEATPSPASRTAPISPTPVSTAVPTAGAGVNAEMLATLRTDVFAGPSSFTELMASADELKDEIPDFATRLRAVLKLKRLDPGAVLLALTRTHTATLKIQRDEFAKGIADARAERVTGADQKSAQLQAESASLQQQLQTIQTRLQAITSELRTTQEAKATAEAQLRQTEAAFAAAADVVAEEIEGHVRMFEGLMAPKQ